ncbi:hypothetical protein RHGRI_005669 [Rhododendron griersonianum]|uniref:Helicase C-terminal domain-containing protein n=1 Tax=Rhododendron griersonianum TaxID=479676 RepID=A0AAV6LDK1_9ERIC|nr:hypothetical protein RHGRI_005669 [Rhododendron griersonianum]
MEDDEWSVYDSEVMESGYDYFKFKEVLKRSKEYLRKLNAEKRLEIIREVLKNPNFNDTDVYYLTMIEIQDPSYKPPSVLPKKPRLRIRFLMSERQPTKPIWEEEEAAGKEAEITGRKRPRGSSDWEFDEEEEKKRVIKKRANKKKVNNVVLPEIVPDLPAEFQERIRNLGGTEATLVLQKELTATDMSPDHTRMSLPRGKLKDKEFLDKAFSCTKRNGKGVAKMEARLIAENGKEHEIDIRQWNMSKIIYNMVKGWNEVVDEHKLCAKWVVQLWSFKVKGNLWLTRCKSFKEGHKRLLDATDLVGRGIDIERVNIVFNYDMPVSVDTYLHRVGRAVRFGTKGLAITFVSSASDYDVLNHVSDDIIVDMWSDLNED